MEFDQVLILFSLFATVCIVAICVIGYRPYKERVLDMQEKAKITNKLMALASPPAHLQYETFRQEDLKRFREWEEELGKADNKDLVENKAGYNDLGDY